MEGSMMAVRSYVCAAMALALCGCYADFPLDATPQAALDDRLLGTWRCLPPDPTADDAAATILFSEARERVYSIRFEEEGGKDPDLFEAHVSIVKERPVLNVRLLKPGEAKPWAFARYSFLLPHVLQLQYVDEDAFKNVEKTPNAFRRALEQLPQDSQFWAEYAVCVRAKADRSAQN